MVKNIAVSDKIVKELNKIREKEGGISYSKAIEKLISKSPEDLLLNEINRRFHELESLMPEMQETWEILRVLAIHIHKLPSDKKEEESQIINEKILSIVKYILSLVNGVVENG